MLKLENSDSRMIPCSEKSEDQDSKMSSPSPESICKQPMKYLSLGISEMIKQRSTERPINFSDIAVTSDLHWRRRQKSFDPRINF
ncbi:hypothetical protein cypCar_00043962 [Cyprinus carpio]|nr:hypothetical protein cypCar_00043962 [Cyprinus carpio]